MDGVSFTLQRVIDDLQTRLSNNSQNVTTYDQLINYGINDPAQENETEKPFEEFKQRYDEIQEVLKKIRNDVLHIDTQLRSLANDSDPSDALRSRWIATKGGELKKIFIDTMIRFKLVQQNHLQVLRVKNHNLEQALWGPDNTAEMKEKAKIVAECLEKVQTDISDNEYRVASLRQLFRENIIFDQNPAFNEQPRFEEINFRENTNPPSATETYETVSRKQRLWIIIFACLAMVALLIIFLNIA